MLAIAASRLGAGDVTGIDDDADAIQAAWDNLALNPRAQVTLIVGDLRRPSSSPADVILANLTGGLLIPAAKRLRQLDQRRRAADPERVPVARGARGAGGVRRRSQSNIAARKKDGYASRFE